MKKLKVNFTTIPNEAILDKRLDTYEFRVLCYLCKLSNVFAFEKSGDDATIPLAVSNGKSADGIDSHNRRIPDSYLF